jgi:hypothetical protein
MTDTATALPLVVLLSLGVLRCLRIYSRTSLNGEIVKAAGLLIIIVALPVGGMALPIAGFVIFNIGYLMAVTFENAFRKEIYSRITFTQRLLGDVPKSQYGRRIRNTYKFNKAVGLLTGMCCMLLGIYYFKGLSKYDITDLLDPGMLFFAGIFFVIFSMAQKKNE